MEKQETDEGVKWVVKNKEEAEHVLEQAKHLSWHDFEEYCYGLRRQKKKAQGVPVQEVKISEGPTFKDEEMTKPWGYVTSVRVKNKYHLVNLKIRTDTMGSGPYKIYIPEAVELEE